MADYDLVVIGGGSAGIIASRFARQLGLTVALLEKSRIGGDCTWTGCIPSKSLLKAANVVQQMRTAQRYGLAKHSLQADLGPVIDRVRAVMQQVHQAESPEALRAEGINILIGPATFQDRRTVIAADRHLTARRFLICTGARPTVPHIPGIEEVDYLTYETVWDLEELPARLAVVGGGPLGCELAQAFQRLGSKVTLLEAADRVLLQDDPEASAVIAQQLTNEGIDLRLEVAMQSVERVPNGVRLFLSRGEPLETDALLLAVGRRPNVEGLGLAEADIVHSRDGIRVRPDLRTNQRHIYAAGDCIGGFQFTHYAAYQGFMAVRNAFLPLEQTGVLERVPWATFTDPEVAHVGLTEAQAREFLGAKAVVNRFSLTHVDRAVTDGDPEGFIKVMHQRNGRLLGATIVAPHAGEMIHEYALALDQGLKLSDLAHLIHVYPTYAMGGQQLATELTVARLLSGPLGWLVRRLAR